MRRWWSAKSGRWRDYHNPVKQRERQRRWNALHPECARDRNHRRKAMILGTTASSLSGWWLLVLADDPCSYCGGVGGTLDHVVALADGGRHSEENLAGACRSCNARKSDFGLLQWLMKAG